MTYQEAIQELQDVKNYCTTSALPALDLAIAVLMDKLEQEQEQEKQ